MAKISVIIPTYKPGDYLITCLESIAKQSFNDFELLIVLNGCNEPYYSFISRYLNIHGLISKTTIIQTDTPGVSNARNIALDNAKGEYIAFIDDDDYISERYLEELLYRIKPNSISVCNIDRFLPTGEVVDYAISKAVIDLRKNGYKNIFKARRLLNSPCMKLYPREIIGDNRFDTEISLGEDALFNFTLSDKIKIIIPANTDAVYYYRIREGSSWCHISKKKLFSHFRKLFSKYTRIYLKYPYKYDLLFYVSRIIAIVVNFALPILWNKKQQ